MRIASLVPSATEMLFALGLGDRVVAVTHECDYPPGADNSPISPAASSRQGSTPPGSTQAVRERTGRGESLYELDEDRLESLDVDLIVTQAVCEVCAVSFDDVRAVAERLPTQPEVISLDPIDARRGAGGRAAPGARRRAAEAGEQLVRGGRRAHRGRGAGGGRHARGRGWLRSSGSTRSTSRSLGAADDRAGRRRGRAGPARREVAHRRVGEVEATAPEVVVSMPCGYYAEQAAAETIAGASTWRSSARGCSRSTRPPTSRAPARGWWTASSCSATCCTPSWCRRRRAWIGGR